MLHRDHTDRWQLADLVATEPPGRPALPNVKRMPAPAARIRIVIDDLIHLIGGFELATRTAMPGLPTSVAALAVPAHQLLRLRARLRSPLSARLRRIHRRRRRTRARVLPCLLLQPPQPILVLHDTARQLENELNTRLTPRVIDPLRLSTVHACKIRCTNQESLPKAPTTERLQSCHNLQGFSAVLPAIVEAWSPRRQGDAGELSALQWLISAGASVYLPWGHSPDVDLVADLDGKLVRVR
jgi:hypothetical protein